MVMHVLLRVFKTIHNYVMRGIGVLEEQLPKMDSQTQITMEYVLKVITAPKEQQIQFHAQLASLTQILQV